MINKVIKIIEEILNDNGEKSNIDIASVIDQNILNIQNRKSFLIKRASQTRKDYDLYNKVNQYIDIYRYLTVSR